MRNRVIPNPCDACVCNYCRWRGTDNCLLCESGSCLRCGWRCRDKHPVYECTGYTLPYPRIRKERKP